MSSLDPLKSVISIMNADNTSLALPSTNQYGKGQLRVQEQVQTLRKTRSRTSSSKSGSTSLSPTGLLNDSVFLDAPSKSHLSTSNGSTFYSNGLSKTLDHEKRESTKWHGAHLNKGASTMGPQYRYTKSYAPVGFMPIDLGITSRSEPDLGRQRYGPKPLISSQTISTKTMYMQRPASQYIPSPTSPTQPPVIQPDTSNSQFVCDTVDKKPSTQIITKVSQKTTEAPVQQNSGYTDITMKDAVVCLSNADEAFQLCGTSYIQHNTFIDNKAKEEVLKLNGISPLVDLLQSQNPQVKQAASAALRNLSFKNNKNKEAIQRHGGITDSVALLRNTDSAEVQKQVTGLLWNLSSEDSLKPDLVKKALPVLMESVILPYTTGAEKGRSDPEIFFNATSCLRNLSSAKQNNRQAMRKCRGLIDSLVRYVKDCVESDKPDDNSLENCVCILHNLTFKLETESPALFSRITSLVKPVARSHSQEDTGPIGCFSPQSKQPGHECNFDFPVIEDPQPNGMGWLIHSQTLQSYLSLLQSSQREETQEACCGTLQNLTAHEGTVSNVMSQMIVQKLNGLQYICPLIKSNKVNLQKSAVSLIGHLTRNPNLHTGLARKAGPELLSVLSAGTKNGNESDDTLAMACQASNYLLMKEPEMNKHLLNINLIKSLNDLTQNTYLPKSKKAAALLLYNLWSEKDLQSALKKRGMTKSSFVNDVTTAAYRSEQIVD